MLNLLPEILWMLLMLGAIIATIVAAIRGKKARKAVTQSLQPSPMAEMGGAPGDLDSFGGEVL